MAKAKAAAVVKVDDKKVEALFLVLRAYRHKLRQRILDFIREQKEGYTTVNGIYRELDLEQSITSQHLKIMREAGLVYFEKEGKHSFYQVDEKRVKLILKLAAKVEGKKGDGPVEALYRLVRAYRHETRREIVNAIRKAPATVTDIYEAVELEQSVASQHLKTLRDARLVDFDRQGKHSFYHVVPKRVALLKEVSEAI